jgi:mRNA-degrading endonuclease toxin of MazEF toxin-antitoxin module
VNFDPVVGSEIRDIRPAGGRLQRLLRSIQHEGRPASDHQQCRVPNPAETIVEVKGKQRRALGDQIRSIDKSRLKLEPVG